MDKYADEIESVLLSEEAIQARIAEMAAAVGEKYADVEKEVVLIAVLKGAAIFVSDFARALPIPSEMEFMAVSSYGSSTSSSGVVRILKDLETDIKDRDVLIVEDVIDSGLTLSWLVGNLRSRGPRSVEVCTMVRKPLAFDVDLDVKYIGFDLPNEFIIGYGLDYAEKYRNLPFIGTLAPHVYEK